MKKLVFYFLTVITLFGCSYTTEKEVVYKSDVCFNTQTELTEFMEFNNFANKNVKLTIKGKNCLEIVTNDEQTIDQVKLTVAAEAKDAEVEVTQYLLNKDEGNDDGALFELPSVSFPNIFDVFDRLIGTLTSPK